MRYRTGSHQGRTIYVQGPTGNDVMIGVMDTPALGELVVAALNDWEERDQAERDAAHGARLDAMRS